MESGSELLDPQDTAKVRVAKEIPAANKQKASWSMEENWPRLKEALVDIWYPYLRGQCDVVFLELGLDPVPKQTVFNVLRRNGRKPITHKNVFPEKKISLLSNLQVKYVEDIIIKRDTANLGMSRKEVI